MRGMFATGVFLLAFGTMSTAQAEDLEMGMLGLTDAEAVEMTNLNDVDANTIRRVYQCRAQDGRGRSYTAIARNRWQAQRRAVNQCRNYAARCYLVSCQARWQIGFGDRDRWDDRWDGRRDDRDDRDGRDDWNRR